MRDVLEDVPATAAGELLLGRLGLPRRRRFRHGGKGKLQFHKLVLRWLGDGHQSRRHDDGGGLHRSQSSKQASSGLLIGGLTYRLDEGRCPTTEFAGIDGESEECY